MEGEGVATRRHSEVSASTVPTAQTRAEAPSDDHAREFAAAWLTTKLGGQIADSRRSWLPELGQFQSLTNGNIRRTNVHPDSRPGWGATSSMRRLESCISARQGHSGDGFGMGFGAVQDIESRFHVLWSPGGGLVKLGSESWKPEAINNSGWVIGCIWGSTTCINRNGRGPYLWTEADGLHNLLDLIAPSDPLLSGLVINNAPPGSSEDQRAAFSR